MGKSQRWQWKPDKDPLSPNVTIWMTWGRRHRGMWPLVVGLTRHYGHYWWRGSSSHPSWKLPLNYRADAYQFSWLSTTWRQAGPWLCQTEYRFRILGVFASTLGRGKGGGGVDHVTKQRSKVSSAYYGRVSVVLSGCWNYRHMCNCFTIKLCFYGFFSPSFIFSICPIITLPIWPNLPPTNMKFWYAWNKSRIKLFKRRGKKQHSAKATATL